MTTYLVTGATGFVGRRFVASLLRRADCDTVHALVRPGSRDRLAAVATSWCRPGDVAVL